MDRISAIIPHWPVRPELNDMVQATAKSLDADEVIIVVNNGTGMGKAINQGFACATGDFLVMCCNDCQLIEGSLKQLCDPMAITVPRDVPGQYNQPRSFYCMPRWIYDTIGGYDEQFIPSYFDDDDLINRWRQLKVPIRIVDGVTIAHQPGTTMNNLPDRNKIFKRNKNLYLAKWGKDAVFGPENQLEIKL